ncbi:MAG: AI-2E family transporter [Actinomycetota bacterium]|nr:AI-2E family transporter [Actinomycetota bacterium]
MPRARRRLRISPRSAVLAVVLLGATSGLLVMVAAAQRVIGWMLVAATLAGLLHPLVRVLERRLPRGVAVLVVMGGLVATAAAVGYDLVDDIRSETRRLQAAAPARAGELERSERFGELARDLNLADRTRRFLDQLPERLRGGTPAEALRAAATRGVAFLATGVLTVFLLLHGPGLARAAIRQVPDPARRERLELIGIDVYRRAFGYARSNLGMALAAGLFAYAVARAAEVPGPAPLGVWVGLWDLVPLAGAAVGALPIVVLAAATSGERALVVALVFVAYQLMENLLVQRRVEAGTLRVGPFLTLFSGLVGLELSGVAGALLCVLAVTVAVAVAVAVAPAEAESRRGNEQPRRIVATGGVGTAPAPQGGVDGASQ